MSQRKEIKATKKKVITSQNSYEDEHQIIFSLKRKQGEQNLDQLYLQNDEEIQLLLNSRKQKKFNTDDLVKQTEQLSINNQKIFVLEKVQLNDEDKDKTVDKGLIQIKRDQFVKQLQKEAREKIFNEKRKKMIIQLEQDRNLLTCIEQTTKYEQEEDYYVIRQVNEDQIDQKAIKFQFDTKNIDKYFDNYYDPNDNDDKISVDSEDSQRSNQDHYDYPDESSSDQNDNDDDDDDHNNYQNDDSYECQRYKRKDIQDQDIEVDEEPIETFQDQSQYFLSFLKQHIQLSKEKKDFKTFDYEKDL